MSMTQTHIQPGSIYTLPSGNIVKVGSQPGLEVECRYINHDEHGKQVVFTVGWLGKNGVLHKAA